MELKDLIKTLPLVPQFASLWTELRQLKSRFSAIETDMQTLDASIGELEASNRANRELEAKVDKMELQLQDLNRRVYQGEHK